MKKDEAALDIALEQFGQSLKNYLALQRQLYNDIQWGETADQFISEDAINQAELLLYRAFRDLCIVSQWSPHYVKQRRPE